MGSSSSKNNDKTKSSNKLDGDAAPSVGLNNQNNCNNNLKKSNNFSSSNNNNPEVDNSQIIKNNKKVGTVTGGNINPNEGGENRIYENKTSKGTNDNNNDNIDHNIGKNELSKGNTNIPSTNSDNISGKEQYFQKSSNIDINLGGSQRNNKENTNKPSTNTGNVEINLGGSQRNNEENYNKPSTNTGNIEINLGGSQRNNEENTNKPSTNTGNVDINIGGNKRNIEENYNKPSANTNKGNKNDEDIKEDFTNKTNNEKNTKYDDEMSSLSESIVQYNYSRLNLNDKNEIEFFRSYSDQKIREGYFPLFLKVNNGKQYFFFVKQDSTLKMLCDYYKYSIDNTIKGKNINLFIEDTNSKGILLDQDTQIKNLNIRQFSKIKGYSETSYF